MKTKTEKELQKKLEEKKELNESKYSSDVERVENVLMGLRHMLTYCDVYWCTAGHAVKPKKLKKQLMKECFKPESTARAMVKGLTGEDYGLFYYDEEEDYLILDSFYVNEFLSNLEFFLCRNVGFEYHEPTAEERKEAIAKDLKENAWAQEDDEEDGTITDNKTTE